MSDISEEIKLNPVSNLSEKDIKEDEPSDKEGLDVIEPDKPSNKEQSDEEDEAAATAAEEEEEVAAKNLKEDVKVIKFTLRLGDVIVIKAPTNEILNGGTFLIEYIDKEKVKLINAESFEKTQLRINRNGVIGDGSITEIKIISSNPNRGYARQHGLLTGTWINIYFGGDMPLIITGQITDLEEDMIEIKTADD
jgi:hypothetical protein